MQNYQRAQVDLLVERLNEPVERIVTIFGPRQCGKTTLVRQSSPAAFIISEVERLEHCPDVGGRRRQPR